MHMFYRVMKGIYQFAANLLSYIPTKYYWNRSTSDLVIAKSKRVNFFLKHSVVYRFCHIVCLSKNLVTNRCLRLFGHIAHSSPRGDRHQALVPCFWQVPPDWKRPAGRPSHTWLRAIEADLGPLNFGLVTAWRKATTRDERQHIVDTATLWKKEEEKLQHCV